MYSARNEAAHDVDCAFKLLPCELGCGQEVMRSESAPPTAARVRAPNVKAPARHGTARRGIQ